MGIIDEALRALGESEERIKQVTAAAIAKQVKYLEDNASGDADGHWEFWSDGLYATSLKEFKKFIKDGSVKGSIISDIISKVNPFMKKIKNMPDPKAVDKNLTYDSYSECEAIRQLEESFFNMFDKRTTRLGTDDAGKILADILKQIVEILTKWIAENSDLSEEQVGFRAAGVQNAVEFALSSNAPIIHNMAKNWFGKTFGQEIENATEANVVEIIVGRMATALENDIRMRKSNLDQMLKFVHREDLLDLNKETLEQYSHASNIHECSDAIINSMKDPIMDGAKKQLNPILDDISNRFSLATIFTRTGIPSESNLAENLKTEIMTDLNFEILERDLNNFDNLSADFGIILDIVNTSNGKIQNLSTQIDDIKSKMDSLRSEIDNLPTELRDKITELMNNDLFGTASGKALTDFPKTVEETISGYYEC